MRLSEREKGKGLPGRSTPLKTRQYRLHHNSTRTITIIYSAHLARRTNPPLFRSLSLSLSLSISLSEPLSLSLSEKNNNDNAVRKLRGKLVTPNISSERAEPRSGKPTSHHAPPGAMVVESTRTTARKGTYVGQGLCSYGWLPLQQLEHLLSCPERLLDLPRRTRRNAQQPGFNDCRVTRGAKKNYPCAPQASTANMVEARVISTVPCVSLTQKDAG